MTDSGQVIHEGQKINPGIRAGEISLQIGSAKREMSGSYTCVATNVAGTDDHTFTMTVLGKFNIFFRFI